MKTVSARREGFTPRWASPPGETIRDAANDRNISPHKLAGALSISLRELDDVVNGTAPITIQLAQRLEAALGGSIGFWVARDGQYRDDLARVKADQWARRLPASDMVRFGWIDKPTDWVDSIAKSLAFFRVRTVESWQESYGHLVDAAHFRLSRLRIDAPAVAVWLRRAEIQAEAIHAADWDARLFRKALTKIRDLTTVRDPKRFVPVLTELCAAAGVVVVIVRAPRGCPASGAARTLANGRRLIVLSARHMSDDHLWFTFFHEAGHLLLHEADSTYVDEFEPIVDKAPSSLEGEADTFAEVELVGKGAAERLAGMELSPRAIVRAARDAGTSPGVIVGQLQHRGRLGFRTRLNGFKQRYRWNGPTLERA